MTSDDDGFTASSLPVRVGPMDVQQKEFRVSRLGGYKMREVDEFLDEITASLTSLIAENERLRTGTGAGPVLGSPDLDDVSRQADEIIQRARDEAAAIVAAARAGAVTAAVGDGSERDAVNAFLVQERGFLQDLAALVQGHADTVKAMAKASRSAGASVEPGTAVRDDATRTTSPDVAATQDDTTTAAAEVGSDADASSTELDDASDADGDADADAEVNVGGDPSTDDPDRTIRIDDPQPASAATSPDSGSDGSLRELFWGEED